MVEEPTDEASQEEPRRRVLAEGPKEKAEGRSGCIITGAILGIVIGLTFAFYGLPPILRSIYGEDVVDRGVTWENGGRTVEVVELAILESDPRQFHVRLAVSTDVEWVTEPQDWTLVMDAGDVLEMTGGDTDLSFEAGESREVVLMFPELPSTDGEPEYVRLGNPKTRFMLVEE